MRAIRLRRPHRGFGHQNGNALSMNRTTISEALSTYMGYRQQGICKTMRVSNWGQVTSGLFVCVLAGCGGGHGSGYGGAPMNPAPTVSFSQPGAAATINFGQ